MTLAVATKGPVSGPVRTYTASAAAMGKGLAVVAVTDDNQVAIAGANVVVLGFVEEANINIGDAIGIVEAGEFYAKVGAPVSIGQPLKTDALGRLVPTASAGDIAVAIALSSGSNANDYIVALVFSSATVAQIPTTYYVANGAIAVASGVADLGSAGALAMTLAAPTTPAQDGVKLIIRGSTKHAHTVQTGANKFVVSGPTSGDKYTWTDVGDFIEIVAVGGAWQVLNATGPTLTEV